MSATSTESKEEVFRLVTSQTFYKDAIASEFFGHPLVRRPVLSGATPPAKILSEMLRIWLKKMKKDMEEEEGAAGGERKKDEEEHANWDGLPKPEYCNLAVDVPQLELPGFIEDFQKKHGDVNALTLQLPDSKMKRWSVEEIEGLDEIGALMQTTDSTITYRQAASYIVERCSSLHQEARSYDAVKNMLRLRFPETHDRDRSQIQSRIMREYLSIPENYVKFCIRMLKGSRQPIRLVLWRLGEDIIKTILALVGWELRTLCLLDLRLGDQDQRKAKYFQVEKNDIIVS